MDRPAALPDSIASLGDSITQAVATDETAPFGGEAHNWSTGDDPGDGVVSHYERLVRAGASIGDRRHNFSVAGARMQDGPRQARRAVGVRASYVTLLMGANDLCRPSLDSMTSVARFRAAFLQTLSILRRGRVDSVLVASIPDVARLWPVLSSDPAARRVWRAFGICRSALSESRRARAAVRRRTVAFNRVLSAGCSRTTQCRYDGGAVFRFPFGPRHVSDLDHFHPSLAGQAALARTTWKHGPSFTRR